MCSTNQRDRLLLSKMLSIGEVALASIHISYLLVRSKCFNQLNCTQYLRRFQFCSLLCLPNQNVQIIMFSYPPFSP